jgi:hypothetical protein
MSVNLCSSIAGSNALTRPCFRLTPALSAFSCLPDNGRNKLLHEYPPRSSNQDLDNHPLTVAQPSPGTAPNLPKPVSFAVTACSTLGRGRHEKSPSGGKCWGSKCWSSGNPREGHGSLPIMKSTPTSTNIRTLCPKFGRRLDGPKAHTARMSSQVKIALVCPKCGRSGEATISEDDSLSAARPGFVLQTISPEFEVIKPSIYWNRIMIRCTCTEAFGVIRRPKSAT